MRQPHHWGLHAGSDGMPITGFTNVRVKRLKGKKKSLLIRYLWVSRKRKASNKSSRPTSLNVVKNNRQRDERYQADPATEACAGNQIRTAKDISQLSTNPRLRRWR